MRRGRCGDPARVFFRHLAQSHPQSVVFFSCALPPPEKNDGSGPKPASHRYPPRVPMGRKLDHLSGKRPPRLVQRALTGGRSYIFFRSTCPSPERNVRSPQIAIKVSEHFRLTEGDTPLAGAKVGLSAATLLAASVAKPAVAQPSAAAAGPGAKRLPALQVLL